MAFVDLPDNEPWQEKGTWYHGFIESDGTNYSITEVDSDIEESSISSSTFRLPAGWTIVDFKIIAHNDYTGTSYSSYNQSLSFYPNDRMGFVLPKANSFDYADIYIFAFKN